jgi:hypothetical protein
MCHEMLTQRNPFLPSQKGCAESAFCDVCRTPSGGDRGFSLDRETRRALAHKRHRIRHYMPFTGL